MFFSENCASHGAKTNFISFVVRKLSALEYVESNRSPLGPLIVTFCLVQTELR